MQIKFLFIFTSLLSLSGCVVLPFDYERSVTPRITGTVIDQETGTPIQSASISFASSSQLSDAQVASLIALTNQDGLFVLEQAHIKEEARIFYLVGDIFGQCTATINVKKQGYTPYTLSVSGPMKSAHFSSVCDGIEDIHVVIELQSSQSSDS